ncbi:hypothetical protein E2C01_075138 [Portunus trituberculatus]|uniref:C2H2-type domain-containing protein n=1 Tax=Portunus trituberculatus TaxID=210409 RepID=A0A5B7IG42_PORTR|nr:hypothetical protein [Portunus trituberculatus]
MNSCSDQSCPYCSKTFTRRSRLRRHLNYHLGNRTFMTSVVVRMPVSVEIAAAASVFYITPAESLSTISVKASIFFILFL